MTLAPTQQTTEQLHDMFPLSAEAHQTISRQRQLLKDTLVSDIGFIGIEGPCSETDELEIINLEGNKLADLQFMTPNLVTQHRLPPYKPRTYPERDWSGLETTDPKRAYEILFERTVSAGNVSLEVVTTEHIRRYGKLSAFVWKGARNLDNTGLIDALVYLIPDTVVGIKNGLDGEIDIALDEVAQINKRRPINSAPAILIFRGGETIQTPELWEKAYIKAYQRTNGMLFVDLAHGSEMAHTKGFKKSVQGQITALEHLTILAMSGFMPKGTLIEASSSISPVDPNMPFNIALNGIIRLAEIARSR
jgi:3-deoxy-D-arabino-heptulosonate 7-phosphate (DAHP) synthase